MTFKKLTFLIQNLLIISVVCAQTLENPVLISLENYQNKVRPGDSSALVLTYKIPYGFWLGANSKGNFTPPATGCQGD
ncbi:MAG: hypothetical protein R3345_01125 [Fulvivirga sp.]|nr:hypothetical protein [Fulvivirga sp.]